VNTPSNRISLFFAQIGHTYTHVFMLLYPTVVLALEPELGMSYGELLVLMTAGNVLFGAAALPAGWLGDKWSAAGMMTVMFIGMGFAAILTGFASGPAGLAIGLALIGLFAAIYHPVGTAWVVRTAENRGRALGVNGVFGSLGVASAGLIAGWLADTVSWRAAFIVPGAVSVATGIALLVFVRRGQVTDTQVDARPEPEPHRDAVIRAFVVLSVTMMCAGLIFQSYGAALPKIFAERAPNLTGGTAAGAGTLVSAVYFCAMGAQLLGGHLADRYPLRGAYLVVYLIQIPLLMFATSFSGTPMFGVVALAVLLNTLAIPIENTLLSRYSPGRWRGTAFGAKFVLSIGVAAASVPIIAVIHDRTGDFYWLFVLLAALATIVAVAALALPREAARARLAVAEGR
jgi:MFS family permease